MESRNKVIIAILVIAVIVAGVMATYYGIGARNTDAKIADLENKLDEANKQVETTKAELAKSNSKINDVKEALGVSEETTTSNDSKNTSIKYGVVDFSNGKCLNPENSNTKYTPQRDSKLGYDITAILDKSGKKVILSISADKAKEYSSEYKTGISKEITNFSKKVVNVFVESLQGYQTEYVLFLMEDGTVEYMKVVDAVKNDSFKSLGAINGVSDVVDIVRGSSGVLTIFGITSTGDYYDIGRLINK